MISFSIDDFILDKDETIWIATLSDGRVVYQDDGRPEYEERSAWVRLKKYCEDNGLFVKKMAIKFRSHTEQLPESNKGYFFRHGVLGSPALKKTIKQFIIGPVVNNKIKVYVYRVPEVTLEETEDRDLKNYKDSVICKTRKRKLS